MLESVLRFQQRLRSAGPSHYSLSDFGEANDMQAEEQLGAVEENKAESDAFAVGTI